MMNKKNLKDIYTLSPMQDGMLFHTALDQKSTAYIEQSEVLFEGDFDPRLFNASWQKIIERHDVFRSVFLVKKTARPIQVVLKEVPLDESYVDLSLKSEDDSFRVLEEFRKKDLEKGFDLSQGPLFRLSIFKLNDQQYKVFWTFHHILMDGWSLGLVLNELFEIYASLKNARPLSLKKPIAYGNYIKWLEGQNTEAGLDYWSNHLETIDQQVLLPQIKSPKANFDLHIEHVSLDKETFTKIAVFTKENGITLNNYIQGVWALCLNLYTGLDDLVFGKTVSGRSADLPHAEEIIGLFINTIPVRIQLNKDETFLELLKRIQNDSFASDEFDWCSLANIQNVSPLKANLINHLIVFENYPLSESLTDWDHLDLGFKIKDVSGAEHTNYDFEIIAMPGETLLFDVKYNQSKYKSSMIAELMNTFLHLCEKGVESPKSLCLDLNRIENPSYFLDEVNSSWGLNASEPKLESVLAQFKRQVKETPNAIAITKTGDVESLSYLELDVKSDQFASSLIHDSKVAPGQLIACMIDRNEKAIITFLGIMKAGAAYIPLDSSFPQDKIEFMLEDSKTNVLILDQKFKDRDFPSFTGDVLVYDNVSSDERLPLIELDLDSCMYVIYTSGSTGTPKGCMVSYGNVGALIQGAKLGYDFNTSDKWVVSHSLCFDVSVWEMYCCLCYGGMLHIPSKDLIADTKQFYSYLVENEITIFNQTPAAFYQVIEEDALRQTKELEKIRIICFAGDRLDLKPIQKWAEKYPLSSTKLVNMYGITETTVHVSYKQITDKVLEENEGESPIGYPLPYYSMLLLDDHQRLVPNGVAGEIYVGGPSVSLGYLNREELTKERYIENPYNPNERLYRSGDLGIRDEKGEILYLGRNDFQVQIRGFRVELGEISYRMQEIDGVNDAVVVSKKEGERDDRLLAFFTVEKDFVINDEGAFIDSIKAGLRINLAEYMVPPQIYKIEKFPLTSNTKIDRKALLKLEKEVLSKGLEETYVAPRNDLERKIAQIWMSILELDKVGVEEDFFEIGGHSIKATLLVTQLSKNLSVDFSLKEIFEARTIESLAHRAQFKKPSLYAQIEKVESTDSYELTYAQKRLWTLDKIQGGAHAYNLHGAFHLKGTIKIDKLEKAFSILYDRHDSLRMNFLEKEGKPFQRVGESRSFSIERETLLSTDEVRDRCLDEIKWVFDLEKGNLFRVKLFSIDEAESILSICLHHIIGDGWSIGVLLKEFSSIYNSLCEDRKVELEELVIQFQDFAYWQNEAIRSTSMLSQRDYWLTTLEGEIPVLELPTDYPRPSEKSFEGRSLHFDLPRPIYKDLEVFNETQKLTLFMGLIGFYNLLLHKYTHQKEIIIGIPISGRYHPDLNNQIGYYLNTLPLKLEVDPEESLKSYFKRLKESVKNAFENQVYPFDELMDQLEVEANPSRSGLYDVMFGLQNFEQGAVSLNEIDCQALDVDSPTSKFDLTMVCEEKNNSLEVNLEYATDLFKTEKIEQIEKHFVHLMKSSFADSEIKIKDLEVLDENEMKNIISDFNAEASLVGDALPGYDQNKGLVDFFAEVVSKHADKLAVSTATESLSYSQLDALSNQIANFLKQNNDLKAQDSIAIYVDRSPWMIACILGILKTGAAYVPIDPKNPLDRNLFLLEDSQSKLLLTQEKYREELSSVSLSLVVEEDVQLASKESPRLEYNADHLIYIMYTSGSSGTPKGVLVEQKSVIALIKDSNYTDIKATDRLLQLSNYSFDGCVYDIFGALLNGASLHLIDYDMLLSPDLLCDYIKSEKINITFITTALINTLIDIDPEVIRQFDKIYFGGQEASLKHIQKALEYRKNKYSIVHVYGPTETTTFTSYYVIDSIDEKTANIPIGSALKQDQLYLLDDDRKPVPIGVTGEIFISGVGVARSYLNRPDETEKVFLDNPYDSRYKLYKTNDLGRWRSDGQIEFLGRKDFQVKIRGFRVEIGEIENAILRHDAIEKVFVMAWSEYKGANKQLVAYYVSKSDLSKADLRTWLSSFLPDYMIPAYMISMSELPLNTNGKVERKKLPSPLLEEEDIELVAPKNDSEEKLHSVWCKLLGRKKISTQDNYFSLGGDSIKAIQMIASLKNIGFKMEIKDLYAFPSIEELALCLIESANDTEEERLTGSFPLTPIQSWFVKEKTGKLDVFNQDILIKWNETIDELKLEKSLKTLFESHDLFRASLKSPDSLKLADELVFEIVKKTLTSNDDELLKITHDLNQEMNLEDGPLFSVALINRPDGSYLYMTIHHMIIDGVSWRILLDNLQSLYLNDSDDLPWSRTSSSKTWVDFLTHTNMFDAELDYWNDRNNRSAQLPLEKVDSYDVKSEERSISVDLTERLLKDAHGSFNTEANDLLLLALSKAFSLIHGQEDSLIYLEGHGREDLSERIDLSHTIGWFTSMYPVLIGTCVENDLSHQVKLFKEHLREIPHKGIGFGVLNQLQQKIDKVYSPCASFNYLGQFESGSKNELFQVSSLKTGKTNADHLALTCPIDIVAYVESDQLKIVVYYPFSLKNKDLVSSVLDKYLEELTKLVNFCCETEDFSLTPSDVDLDGFDIDALDDVLDNL